MSLNISINWSAKESSVRPEISNAVTINLTDKDWSWCICTKYPLETILKLIKLRVQLTRKKFALDKKTFLLKATLTWRMSRLALFAREKNL